MKRFIEGEDRTQVTLLPACLEDYVEAENPVRVVEIFVDGVLSKNTNDGGGRMTTWAQCHRYYRFY